MDVLRLIRHMAVDPVLTFVAVVQLMKTIWSALEEQERFP